MAVKQEQHHAYDADGNYIGIIVATASQLSGRGWTAGNAAAPDMAVLKSHAADQVKDRHAKMLSDLTGNPSPEERDTWPPKEAAARAHIEASANAIQTSLLTEEATRTGETLDVLAATVVAKADHYYTLAGIAAGLRRAATTAIESCTDAAAIKVALADHEIQQETETALFMAG